ncbi:MAG: hypothetical protein N838_33220 [Thiohalocapsa sp. PB-PSB1]|jgi:hypothetical protein|nr:MAG: hypothetical protein N838_32260 [Thiohalocapsa sp. PB-PSB1]QQO57496.1 MAG: hypothetical protein N838_33220 [Thiohalocapsa sp. PB-PSB1]
MGSIATLYFSGYPVEDTKNRLDQWIFKESDKRVFERKLSERNDLTWGEIADEGEVETAYVFEATVETIINRLEVLGYTLEACKRDFIETIKEELRKLPELQEYDAEFVRSHRAICANFGKFEQWLEAFSVIVRDRPKEVFYMSEPERVHEDDLINYMLNPSPVWSEDWHPCGFQYPSRNFNFFARAFLESCDRRSSVQLDATDLVNGGWYEGFEHLEDVVKPHTRFFDVFQQSAAEVSELAGQGEALANTDLLAKVLFANVITALETYLSDTFVHTVISFPPLIRRLVESDPEFQKRKLELKDIFRRHDGIKGEVAEYLEGLMYHNLAKVRELYRGTLCVEFPKEMAEIFRAIEDRHDIVHRNGRRRSGEVIKPDLSSVEQLLVTATKFVEQVDSQVKDVYPKVLDGEF